MKRTHANFPQNSHRQGLTLLELLVVMVILIALGGIVMTMLPNFLTKTHDATTVTNIQEVNKAMMGFLSTNLSYPDQFDSIVDTSGSMYTGAIFRNATYTPTTGGTTSPVFNLQALTANQSASLTAGGINNLMVMKAAPTNATFDAYIGLPGTTGAMLPVTSNPSLMVAADNYIYQKFNMPQRTDNQGNTLAIYVVVGLGQYCTIVGSTSFGIFEAPISFGEHTQEQPTNSYARILCVFRVYNDGSRAEFVGCAHPDATGLGTADMHMQEYYQTK